MLFTFVILAVSFVIYSSPPEQRALRDDACIREEAIFQTLPTKSSF